MASRLSQLRSKATQASKLVAKNGPAYYKQALEKNKQNIQALASMILEKNGPAFYKQLLEKNMQYIQDPPTVEACKLLSNQLFYTRLASFPGRYESLWKEIDYVKQLWNVRKTLTTEHYGLATLCGVELYAWLCAGEIVGRGFTFTGYHV